MMYQPTLGLKASSDAEQLGSRLRCQPEILEFFTSEHDISEAGLARLRTAIDQTYSSGVKDIVLHHPMKYRGLFMELTAHPSNNQELVEFINYSTAALLDIAREKHCRVLVHGSYEMREPALLEPFASLAEAEDYLFSRLDELQALGGELILFENGISPLFSFGDPRTDQLLAERDYLLAYDISHAFIHAKGDNAALQASLALLRDRVIHYHLVDSMGKIHDSLPLGQGKIDWAALLPLLNPKATSIYEIVLQDVDNPAEQLASHRYLQELAGGAVR